MLGIQIVSGKAYEHRKIWKRNDVWRNIASPDGANNRETLASSRANQPNGVSNGPARRYNIFDENDPSMGNVSSFYRLAGAIFFGGFTYEYNRQAALKGHCRGDRYAAEFKPRKNFCPTRKQLRHLLGDAFEK